MFDSIADETRNLRSSSAQSDSKGDIILVYM